ncbi:hypothetical protein [Pseudoduganella albidiflava]|uniref:Secreted protein n=1 Tax=Pseudoduganella albidiflava TaxID=321983 RepID=A0ABX5RYJ2_9BURK|nr:hypothetical protein [Pseudoduganella albidiflava]QBI03742.1 hypothetical protein EYF70_25160 [Pseudoduganella albidiflava]
MQASQRSWENATRTAVRVAFFIAVSSQRELITASAAVPLFSPPRTGATLASGTPSNQFHDSTPAAHLNFAIDAFAEASLFVMIELLCTTLVRNAP